MLLSAASIGPANKPSMPGSMTRQRTLVSSTSICAVDLLAHRRDVEVELVARPSSDSPARRRPGCDPAACGCCWRCAAGLRRGRACVAGRRRSVVPSLRQWAGIQRFSSRGAAHYDAAMRWISTLLLFAAAPAAARSIAIMPIRGARASPNRPVCNPAAAYITIGQDEPGYRNWYVRHRRARAPASTASTTISMTYGVGGIVPTWQMLRTATSWQRCGAAAVRGPADRASGRNIVQTLRYIRDYVVPRSARSRPVSAYRNPVAQLLRRRRAGKRAQALFRRSTWCRCGRPRREELMRKLCAVHARRGTDYRVGLGFYAFLRFHVDTTKYRRWGADPDVRELPADRPAGRCRDRRPPVTPSVAAGPSAPPPVCARDRRPEGRVRSVARPAATTPPQPQQH